MPTLQQQIIATFLAALAETNGVTADKIEMLRIRMTDPKRLKADDFVNIFTLSDSGDVK
jgi:hypothetical protein